MLPQTILFAAILEKVSLMAMGLEKLELISESEMGRVSRASQQYLRRVTVREMKEGPSGSVVRD